jgi:hypothetical protein
MKTIADYEIIQHGVPLSNKDLINEWIREQYDDIDCEDTIDIETPSVFVSIRVKE